MEQVTVYRFKVYDVLTGKELLAPRAATSEIIGHIQIAKPIVESAQEVDRNRIDGDGFLNK